MKSLLIVEPDLLSGELYKDALATVGCEVRLVDSGQLALDELDESPPDCIVLEIDMVGHNGFEFLYEFCSHDDWAHIPIILHTGIMPDKFSSMMIDWRDLNVVEYLYKPQTSLHELQQSVKSLIGAQESMG